MLLEECAGISNEGNSPTNAKNEWDDEDEENENLGGMQKQLKEERIDGVTLMILHNNTNWVEKL